MIFSFQSYSKQKPFYSPFFFHVLSMCLCVFVCVQEEVSQAASQAVVPAAVLAVDLRADKAANLPANMGPHILSIVQVRGGWCQVCRSGHRRAGEVERESSELLHVCDKNV